MSQRETILAQFEPDIATSLIEFSKSISSIDADYIIFMARKAICLYDVFRGIGFAASDRIVLSDRVLETNTSYFKSKRIALVDDALILGTTLAETRKTLIDKYDAKVSTHVFCVNRDWWCKDLIEPDTVFLSLDDNRCMTFCSAIVRALSLLPRPYLVDFPILKPMKVPNDEQSALLTSIDWVSYRVSSDLQRRNGIDVFTFFPTDELFSRTFSFLGNSVIECLDIVKVRLFSRLNDEMQIIQPLPIVTLKPMDIDSLEQLNETIFELLEVKTRRSFSPLIEATSPPVVRQRLIQYVLSVILGSAFIESLRQSGLKYVRSAYDHEEAIRHFGPWFLDEFKAIHSHARPDAFPKSIGKNRILGLGLTPIPVHTIDAQLEREILPTSRESINLPLASGDQRDDINNLLTGFTQIFLKLFEHLELPARKEAHRLGSAILNATEAEAPNRNRLRIGIPWFAIIDRLAELLQIEPKRDVRNLLSLVLDICNDLGIAVPITVQQGNVILRAYRHGEDVRFSDNELGLAWSLTRGFLSQTTKPLVPQLTMQKLLVLLTRIGAAEGFLEPFYGPSGTEGTVRIGFNLHGAIPILGRSNRTYADRGIWLSKFLERRRVIVRQKGGFALGENVSGNYIVSSAPEAAYRLGIILGKLLQTEDGRKPALSSNDLVLIASCWYPRLVAGALQAELDIVSEWYESQSKNLHISDFTNAEEANSTLNLLKRGQGHTAVHSATFKVEGFIYNRPVEIVKRCEAFLREELRDELAAATWSAYWKSMDAMISVGEAKRFEKWIASASRLCWEMSFNFGLAELSLARALAAHDNNSDEGTLKALTSILQLAARASRANTEIADDMRRYSMRIRGAANDNFIRFNPASTYRFAIGKIEEGIAQAKDLVELIGPQLMDFGRIPIMSEYKFMLHYDLIDSRANGPRGPEDFGDAGKYATRVGHLKSAINESLHKWRIVGINKGCEIYCWNGHKSSVDDGKHIFFNGKFASRYLFDVCESLFGLVEVSPSVSIRIHLVPCNFVGSSLIRAFSDPEVRGDRFWHHWTGLKTQIRQREDVRFGRENFLAVVTDELFEDFGRWGRISWSAHVAEIFMTEAELLTRSTNVMYGIPILKRRK